MSVAALLTRGRLAAQRVMVDACTVTRTTVGALNESTGVYAETTATVYTGRCRVKPAATATIDAAGIAVDTARPTLDLPWSETGLVQPGDRVTITTGPLAGTVAEVFAEVAGSTMTKRRYTLEVQA